MSIQKDIESFKEALDNEYTFPVTYTFKFIVPKKKEEELKAIFPSQEFVVKESKGGNYLSYTMHQEVESSDAVINVYQQAYAVEGIISL